TLGYLLLFPRRLTVTIFPYTTLFRSQSRKAPLCAYRALDFPGFFNVSCFIANGASRPLPGSTKEFWIPASAGKTEGLLGQAEFAFWEKAPDVNQDRKSTRLNSSHVSIS